MAIGGPHEMRLGAASKQTQVLNGGDAGFTEHLCASRGVSVRNEGMERGSRRGLRQYSSGRSRVIVIWNYLLARRLSRFAPPGCMRIGHSAASEPERHASSRCVGSMFNRFSRQEQPDFCSPKCRPSWRDRWKRFAGTFTQE
jgi:hypothetical protein